MSRIRFIAPVLHVTGRRHHHRIIKAHARHWMILKCSESDASMCDYSLDLVASRPAKVGDKLVTTKFQDSLTRGFAPIGEPNVAVCLLPGTEIASILLSNSILC